MKILFLSNSIGGLKSFRMELIEALKNIGYEVAICSPCEISADLFSKMGCKIYPLNMSRHGKNPFKELFLLKSYKTVIQDFYPDIVLSYTIKPNIYGSIICHKLKVPIICSVTGLGVAVENKGLMQMISVAMMKYALRFADHVYFQNIESQHFFSSHKISLKSQSLVAGSGVNLEKFGLKEYPSTDHHINFLYTGRILEAKGIGLYLNAAKILKAENPNLNFHIVGIKDDEKYSKMVDEFAEKGIIIFHGYQKDPRKFIELSHCQIHPTYYPEGMSNVLLESAAMGRPAITTDKSGCKEIVDDSITGYIIKQRDENSLIEAIRKFISLPFNQKRDFGLNAHNKVAKYFDRKIVVDEYIKKLELLTKSN